MSQLAGKNIVSIDDLSKDNIQAILDLAKKMQTSFPAHFFEGRLMASLFFEPSTRTRLSFESAFLRLGGGVVGSENAREFTSTKKGEAIEDTVRILDKFVDVIVMRSHEEGFVARAASVSAVPIINAGDGPGEHPTQTLLDLYTIQKELGRLDNLRVAMIGDLLNGRTVRSLSRALRLYSNIEIYFVSPRELQMRDDVKEALRKHNIPFFEHERMEDVLGNADVIYITRIQKERFGSQRDYERLRGIYVFDEVSLARLKKDAIVMHPLPRVGEISPSVDGDPRAVYFKQVENGLYVRMSLLLLVLGY